MKVTIIGGGNVGTQFAVHCAEKGWETTIFTSKDKNFERTLEICDETGAVVRQATIAGATYDCKIAFGSADLIFVTTPAFCASEICAQIAPYVRKGTYIGLIPGIGGMECAFKDCFEKGCILFGLQRVPSVARLVEYGKKVCAVGYRDHLYVAALPNGAATKCAQIMENLFDIPCTALPNYLNITLIPSNPILHTTRLYNLFRDYEEGKSYERVPLFYEDWNDESSELLLNCDNEVQKIKESLKDFDLSWVKSLKEHYEGETKHQITDKIRSIRGFKGLTTPTKQVGDRYYPDFSSRYFVADFSYGLEILKQIAEFVNVKVPYIDMVLQWYRDLRKDEKSFNYSDYGINNYESFLEFYSK